MNYRILKARMIENGLNRAQLCKAIGINPCTWWRKVNNGNNFTLPEIKSICEVLHLSNEDRDRIFFGDDCA